eukprot:g29744.t1
MDNKSISLNYRTAPETDENVCFSSQWRWVVVSATTNRSPNQQETQAAVPRGCLCSPKQRLQTSSLEGEVGEMQTPTLGGVEAAINIRYEHSGATMIYDVKQTTTFDFYFKTKDLST